MAAAAVPYGRHRHGACVDACGADDNARWAVSGGSDTIGLSYGPIGIIMSLGSGGRGEEGSRNVGGAAAIWADNYANAGVSGHPMWDSVQLGRLE